MEASAEESKTKKPGALRYPQYPHVSPKDLSVLIRLVHQIYPYFKKTPLLSRRHDLAKVVDIAVKANLESDFFWAIDFEPEFYAELFYNGFLPIATRLSPFPPQGLEQINDIIPSLADHVAKSKGLCILMPKLHKKRCLVQDWDTIHVGKSARKRSKKYRISFDLAIDTVMEGCVKQHGEDWLYPPVRDAFRSINRKPVTRRRKPDGEETGKVRVHSIELWEDEKIVAGELGYSFGKVYTSLTGYYIKDSTGTIQMLAMAGLLKHAGYQLWDLGMTLKYKEDMGAREAPRATFVERLHQLRDLPSPSGALPTGKKVDARAAIDFLRKSGSGADQKADTKSKSLTKQASGSKGQKKKAKQKSKKTKQRPATGKRPLLSNNGEAPAGKAAKVKAEQPSDTKEKMMTGASSSAS